MNAPAAVEMTPRERWLATLEGRPVDRLATDYWGTPEITAKIEAETGLAGDALWDHLGVDRLRALGPRSRISHHPDDPQANIWGIRHRRVDYGTGTYDEAVHHPLARVESVRDLDDFRWPRPEDMDVDGIREALASDDGTRLVRAGHYEPFLLYCGMRGMEQAYVDLIESPDLAEAILDRIFRFHFEVNRRIFEAGEGRIDLFYLAEDLGGQHGPLFSLDTYRRFLRPGQKRMAELAHSFGVRVFYHTDGAARPFLPDLIEEVGIDILNPLQWRCPGMDLPELVRDFAAHIAFHGGIDNQHTLPFATEAEVRAQVRWCADIMARHRARWICAPCHNIQSVTPVANVLAMYDEAGCCGLRDA